jgi:hypothetical protein
VPASLPGATLAQNLANPSQGAYVGFDPLSGPKGSPFDRDSAGNCSTGGLSTGIGMDCETLIGPSTAATAPANILKAGFSDDATPGVTRPSGVAAADSTLMYIGGGRSNMVGVPPVSTPVPYTAGFALVGGGNGGSRDGGAGPAFTGFPKKMVTAIAVVANGAAIEAGFTNRTGLSMAIGDSAFGSSTAANAAAA